MNPLGILLWVWKRRTCFKNETVQQHLTATHKKWWILLNQTTLNSTAKRHFHWDHPAFNVPGGRQRWAKDCPWWKTPMAPPHRVLSCQSNKGIHPNRKVHRRLQECGALKRLKVRIPTNEFLPPLKMFVSNTSTSSLVSQWKKYFCNSLLRFFSSEHRLKKILHLMQLQPWLWQKEGIITGTPE